MIDQKLVRNDPDRVADNAKKRGVTVNLDRIRELEATLKVLRAQVEHVAAEKNAASKHIATADSTQKKTLIEQMRSAAGGHDTLKQRVTNLEQELNGLLLGLPNFADPAVPVGKSDRDNVVLKTVGGKTAFTFEPVDYLTIAERLDLIDTKRAGKVAGTRFGYLKGKAAELEFAIVSFVIAELKKKGFTLLVPPQMVREEYMRGLGYLEHGETVEKYHLPDERLYLIGSAEHTLVPYYAGETLPAADLPIRLSGFSTCFRREAGSYGKDTKGILRVHQFDKLEMVSFSTPEQSSGEFDALQAVGEHLVHLLEIPYRLVALCTADLPFPSARSIDIECWLPGQGTYRETHTVSNCTDFQARRLGIKYRGRGGAGYVHTVNNTALAIPRTLIAIIENFQTEQGTVRVPKALQPYCGFEEIG